MNLDPADCQARGTLCKARPGRRLWQSWLLVCCLALLASLGFGRAGAGQAATSAKAFDHLSTGYALSGSHANEKCEACHLNGIFKGTPRDCASCHKAGTPWSRANVVKTAQHLPTSQGCDSCHNTRSFTGAKFSHQGVAPASCQGCHNGSGATGKPAGHLGTTASCDACHLTSAWLPATAFDHSGVLPGTCLSCHGPGGRGTQKPIAHVPVSPSQSCDACHRSFSYWKPSSFNHTQVVVAAQCSSCHSGNFPPADGKPAQHLPYAQIAVSATANCDACHRGGFSSWNPGRFHANFSTGSQCATCHTGGYLGAVGKPATPVHTGVTNCETCHNTSGWAGARVDHSGFSQATNCASCHNGTSATGKPVSHAPVGVTNCYACHSVNGWKPTKWNHSQVVVTGQCAACHSGAYPPADGKPGNHIPYLQIPVAGSANCDACHKAGFASWNPGRFHAGFSVTGQCSSCHTGSYLGAVGKPATPVHSGVSNCESCHNTVAWNNAKVDHAGFNQNTNCASCHDGRTATGKSASHVPVGNTSCYSCHSVGAWKPTKWNHTQLVVTRQCASCHTGAYPPADGKVANHVPYQLVAVAAAANCDACHRGGYASWNPGRFHANFVTGNQCATCHTGGYLAAVGKPANPVHQGVTTCESCHRSTSDWRNVQYTHAPNNQVGSGTCDSCHNGVTATGKTAGHIPIQVPGVKCDACHRSQAAWSTAVSTNHAVLTAQPCKTCHIPTYVSQGSDAKPGNHIPESQLLNGAAMDCKACHTSTSSWPAMKMNHNSSMGSGAGWCKACHATGTNYLGNLERKALNHQSQGKTPIDCSQSGCHRPLGNKGNTFVNWDN